MGEDGWVGGFLGALDVKAQVAVETLNMCEGFTMPKLRLLSGHVNYLRKVRVLLTFCSLNVGILSNYRE